MAPGKVSPPELVAKHSWVEHLHLSWADVGGLSRDEIDLLVQMLNVIYEARALQQRVRQKGAR